MRQAGTKQEVERTVPNCRAPGGHHSSAHAKHCHLGAWVPCCSIFWVTFSLTLFFFFNIYILIKKIFWFLKYQYIFVDQLWYRVDSLQSLLYSIRSRWNIFFSPGKNIFFPKFFVENIIFLAKSLFFLHQTLYYCLLAAVYYFLHIWVHLRITCPSPTTSFQNFIWHLNFKLSCY